MNRRALVYIAVFGTFWGLVEASLGTILHALHIPFTGSVLSALGLIILLTARSIIPIKGSSFSIAIIAGVIKIVSFSTVKLGPFIGIASEGIIVELVLSITGVNRFSFFISGLLVGIYPIIQTVITKSILFGADFVPIILELARGFSDYTGFSLGWVLLTVYLAVQVLLALTGAHFAWSLVKRLDSRKSK